MMSDKLTEEIRKVINYQNDTNDEQVWADYIDYFQGLPAFNRKQVLTFVDTDCLDIIPVVTKDSAKVFQKRRQLSDINELMLRAGK
jgi:hypothetical protein